jgi:hypothetical protein
VFPDHALSRVRRHVRTFRKHARLKLSAKWKPRFDQPTAGATSEMDIQDFMQTFAITAIEREEASALGAHLTGRLNDLLAACARPTTTGQLLGKDGGWSALSEEIANKTRNYRGEQLCLILYSASLDQRFVGSMKEVTRFYAQRDNDPLDLLHVDDMASADFRHWEFVFSRLMARNGYRCVAIRRDSDATQNFGVSLIEATQDDWLAKLTALTEFADVIFCASIFNENLVTEFGHILGDPRLRRKFIYRSTHKKFLLASEPDKSWSNDQLNAIGLYVAFTTQNIRDEMNSSSDGKDAERDQSQFRGDF